MQSTPDLIHIGSLKSWTAPECTSINRVPMRATAYPFPTAQSARSVDREKTPWFQSLNGQWQFKAADRPENVVLTDIAVDSDRANWDSVEVPGNWTLQGYGAPQYTNVQMPFADEPPFVPGDNLTGIYAKEFSVPADWKGRRVVLHLGGAEKRPVCLYKRPGDRFEQRLPPSVGIRHFTICAIRSAKSRSRGGSEMVGCLFYRRPGSMVDGRTASRGLYLFHRLGSHCRRVCGRKSRK